MHSRYHFCSSIFVSIAAISLVLILAGPSRAQVIELKLIPSDGGAFDNFGHAVSLFGDRALVGAEGHDHPKGNKLTGSAYVFERQPDGSWLEVAELLASDGEGLDRFGSSVSLSDEFAIVGAWGNGGGVFPLGAAYVFERLPGGSWIEAAKLTGSDITFSARFGFTVSIAGNRAIVGAPHDGASGDESGSAFVFERQENGTWLEVAKLISSYASFYDHLGDSVSIWGDRAIVGAPDDNVHGTDSGMAYIFERQPDGSWIETDKLFPSDIAESDHFGTAVSLSEDRVLVTSNSFLSKSDIHGAVYVFKRNQFDGSWIETAKMTTGGSYDGFGYSVSDSGDYAVIAAPFDSGDFSGSAYVYKRQGDGSWIEVEELTASDASSFDRYGYSVAISQNWVLVGAWGADGAEEGGGAVYVYENLIPVVNEPSSNLPSAYRLETPYPNPFNPRAVVPFEVPEAAHVRLTVLDIFGREVATLLDGQVAAGSHEAVLDGGNLASGVYLVRLEAEGVVHATQKVLLLR